jgi:hypothetical protein
MEGKLESPRKTPLRSISFQRTETHDHMKIFPQPRTDVLQLARSHHYRPRNRYPQRAKARNRTMKCQRAQLQTFRCAVRLLSYLKLHPNRLQGPRSIAPLYQAHQQISALADCHHQYQLPVRQCLLRLLRLVGFRRPLYQLRLLLLDRQPLTHCIEKFWQPLENLKRGASTKVTTTLTLRQARNTRTL